jgi:hypothetical protein
LAKKTRTPAPPRKVQAPKRKVQAPKVRTTKQKRELRRPTTLGYAIAGSGLLGIAAVVGLAVVLSGGGGGGRPSDAVVARTAAAAGCTVTTVTPVPNFKPDHSTVPNLSTPVDYSSFPPAAGAHYGQRAIWGFFTEPVNPRQVVHNEEHGGVIIWMGPKTPQSTIDKLNQFYSSDPDSMLGTLLVPAPSAPTGQLTDTKNPGAFKKGLGSKFAVTAWTGDPSRYYVNGYLGFGHAETCSSWNAKTEKALSTFRDAYRGLGPERYPISANKPGT